MTAERWAGHGSGCWRLAENLGLSHLSTILDDNPLEDIRNSQHIAMVMKNGRLYDAMTMAQVYPKKGKARIGGTIRNSRQAPSKRVTRRPSISLSTLS